MPEESANFTAIAVIIEGQAVRVLGPLAGVDALSLGECASEDPTTWNDIVLLWPRCRLYRENLPSILDAPIREMDLPQAIVALAEAPAWMALDLKQRRYHTGGRFPLMMGRKETPSDDRPRHYVYLLAPWWEFRQEAEPSSLAEDRSSPLVIPDPHRSLLWDGPACRFFAKQMIAHINRGDKWMDDDGEGRPRGDHDATIAIHRDWLMTPHPDLDGGIPRDCLHIAMDWVAVSAQGQMFRIQQNESPIPVPEQLSNFESAALGTHEVVMYFHACRETLQAGWQWLLEDPQRLEEPQVEGTLAQTMQAFMQTWLDSPFEGRWTAREIIDCERRRIPLLSSPGRDDPRGSDLGHDHGPGEDCPICEMMAEGVFGPAMIGFDGYSLEEDGEFAFSLTKSRSDWESENEDLSGWAALDLDSFAGLSSKDADRDTSANHGLAGQPEGGYLEAGDALLPGSQDPSDPFSSPWKQTFVSDQPIPGDPYGHLGAAFFLTELIDAFRQQALVPEAEIAELLEAFRQYRTATPDGGLAAAAQAFKDCLEQIGSAHPELLSRAADLQSRIDQSLRARRSEASGN